MKQYPKYDAPEGERGFSEEEIKHGIHALYIDVTCAIRCTSRWNRRTLYKMRRSS